MCLSPWWIDFIDCINIELPILQDFMALLAYKEPEKSPMFHLLSLEYRQQVADSLNRAILGWSLNFLYACVVHLFLAYNIYNIFSFKIQYIFLSLSKVMMLASLFFCG